VLFGHFARFNEWTEIRSHWEGDFMERFVPGAFKKTIRESRDRMRVLFQHGQDPEVGDKPIAAISDLREDDEGAYYEASLFDGLPALVMDGLRESQYGASFRFGVLREEIVEDPGPSDYNPHGLPERTVKEARVQEFGPVTFPAYAGATAGVRSVTDDFILSCFRSSPDQLRAMFDKAAEIRTEASVAPQDAPSEDDAETDTSHLADERRETDATTRSRTPIYGQRREETSKPWLLGASKSTKQN
jgi:HK97 family phage prohead protease